MRLDFCVACGCKEGLHHHHLIPRIMGGTDDETNLITLCEEHHGAVHGTTFHHHTKLQKKGIKRSKEKGVRWGRKDSPRPTLECLLANEELIGGFLPAMILFSYGYNISHITKIRWQHIKSLDLNTAYLSALLSSKPEEAFETDYVLISRAKDSGENAFSVRRNRLMKSIKEIEIETEIFVGPDELKAAYFLLEK